MTWLRGRKKTASITALAVVIATPVTLAVLHQGFPISDVDLTARDVWVTNGSDLLTGRLNTQIAELNGGVTMASRSFDVMQDGDDVFTYDEDHATVERVDPAYVSLGQNIAVPPSAEVTYGGSTMTILRPSDGALWVVDTSGELQFDPENTEPVIELGKNAHAVATLNGTVYAVSAKDGMLYSIAGPGAGAVPKAAVTVDDYDLSAVGERGVILDRTSNSVIKDDGGAIALPDAAFRIQQPGPERDYVVVATGGSLLRVGFGGEIHSLDGNVSTEARAADQVSAPVVLGTCIHGAWAASERYLGVCDGKDPYIEDIPQSTAGSKVEFRVNRSVIALNNLTDGNVWLVTQSMRLVENWEEVTPPQLDEAEDGDEKASVQTFEDTLAERTDQNQPPIARPDALGVRPGKTTILGVLENDTDPDGDVLTITNVSDVPATSGVLQLIDGGRALQFVPSPDASGTVSFRYTVSDGRPGGVAETQVDVTIRPLSENLPPVKVRASGLNIEAGQTATYNVLTDWIDPDGDDLLVTAAAPTTADVVRFRPDGQITFTNISTELGQKIVDFTVSDGTASADGQLIVDVKAPGELNPIGTPDFTSTFVGEPVEILPLGNDRSPSGAALALVAVEPYDDGVTATLDLDRGTITAFAPLAGVYYLKYTLSAGPKTSIGIVRVDVLENPDAPIAPIAVKDTAYVRPNEPTSLAALANDQSPNGNVIGIQSIDIPQSAEQISVEVLNSSVLRITAPSGMTSAVNFTYTISDGVSSSTAGVSVVPVPELTKHQAPIATDDAVKVRVGDVATVAVLDNDYHPDGARMLLDPELGTETIGDDGLAFVTGDRVRIQAPSEPGQYSLTYRIYDAFEESAVANVIITVLDVDTDSNAAPLPRPVTARVFQGGSVTIDVPLDGIDPDGDSVVFTNAAGATLGEIKGKSSTAFTYEAYGDSAGTDTFSYQVRDAFGATATGVVRIGVLPRPDTVLPPSAVNDEVSIRPERTATVPVMANDSDPNGYPIHVLPDLLEVADGITAKVDGEAVIITAGEVEGTYTVHYGIDNGNGGTDDAFLTVDVDPAAAVQPPVAVDHVVEPGDVVGQRTVDVKVLDGAQNPGGLISDLVVAVGGANAKAAEVLDGGEVRVTLGDTRQAVAYSLTNDIDDLTAMAFVIVPAYADALPPVLKPALVENPPAVPQNQTKEWKLSDLVDVPSGRDARIINPETATAGRSNGDPIVADETTIRYTPEQDFRGKVQLTFEVTDGASATDAKGNRATIDLTVIVGDANFEDVPPKFSNSTVAIESGEAATVIDLRTSSSHPNPSILQQLSYGDVKSSNPTITATVSGSNLSLSAPAGPPGETSTVTFTVNYKDFHVAGEIDVRTVSSTRPLPQAVDDVEPEGRPSSSYTISPLTNDFNPFAAEGDDLKITSAVFEGANLGATLSSTASTVTVGTSTTKSGTISVIYTVRDRTNDPAREVQGRITIVVASAPEPVTSFTLTQSPHTVLVNFDPPSSSNGAEITGYTVNVDGQPGSASQPCVPTEPCVFPGRTDGETQQVTVLATNKVGTTVSGVQSITPYDTPSAPTNVTMSTGSAYSPTTLTGQWSASSYSGGKSLTYTWSYQMRGSGNNWYDFQNNSGTTSGTSAPGVQDGGAGNTQRFAVLACNDGGLCSPPAYSAEFTPQTPPVTSWTLTVDTQDTCVQDQLNTTRYTPPSTCAAPGYWQAKNSSVTVGCYTDASIQVQGNYRFYRLPNGFYISQYTMRAPYDTSVPAGMPAC